MAMYTKKVMQHFLKPRNVGRIANADGVGKAGNPVCGDVLVLYIKVGKRKKKAKSKSNVEEYNVEEYIKDIKFETLGCAAAIAVSSMLTEMVKGKTLEEAKKISNKDIVKALGGLPQHKLHCSLLGQQALMKAIEDYERKKKKQKIKKQK